MHILILIVTMLSLENAQVIPEEVLNCEDQWVRPGISATVTEVDLSDYRNVFGDLLGRHLCMPDSMDGQWRLSHCYRDRVLILTENGEERLIEFDMNPLHQRVYFSPNGRYLFMQTGGEYTGRNALRIDTETAEQVYFDLTPNGGWGGAWMFPHNDGSVITRRFSDVYFFDEDLSLVFSRSHGDPRHIMCSDNGDVVIMQDLGSAILGYSGEGELLWTIEMDG